MKMSDMTLVHIALLFSTISTVGYVVAVWIVREMQIATHDLRKDSLGKIIIDTMFLAGIILAITTFLTGLRESDYIPHDNTWHFIRLLLLLAGGFVPWYFVIRCVKWRLK
jgi:hypothetical protein